MNVSMGREQASEREACTLNGASEQTRHAVGQRTRRIADIYKDLESALVAVGYHNEAQRFGVGIERQKVVQQDLEHVQALLEGFIAKRTTVLQLSE